MSQGRCCIEKASNGYSVCLDDPAIRKANSKPNSKWRDPECKYVFADMKKMFAFLEKALPASLVEDEYDSTFDKALAEPLKD